MMIDSQKALKNSHAFSKLTLARLRCKNDLNLAIIEVHMLIAAIELWASLRHGCETHLPYNILCLMCRSVLPKHMQLSNGFDATKMLSLNDDNCIDGHNTREKVTRSRLRFGSYVQNLRFEVVVGVLFGKTPTFGNPTPTPTCKVNKSSMLG